MGCFYYWGGNFGFPWFWCIIPLVFFLVMICMMCRFRGRGRFVNCCKREMPDLTDEVNKLRREMEAIKKK